MTQASTRRSAASVAIVLGLLASLVGCDQRPPEPKAPGAGGTTTAPAPMPPASAASQ
jgi:hypothetical protein